MATKKNPTSSHAVSSAGSTPATPAKSAAEAVKAPAAAAAPVAAPAAAPVAASAATPVAAAATATLVAPTPARTETVRDRSSIVALIAKLNDADAEVARDAAATLAKLPADTEAVTALCGILRNAENFYHPVVRAAAASALGALKDPRAIDALIHATGDSMAEASEEAAKALGLLADKRAIATLERIVKNEENYYVDTVRHTAEQSLRNLRG